MDKMTDKVAYMASHHGDIWAIDRDAFMRYVGAFELSVHGDDAFDDKCCPRKVELRGQDGMEMSQGDLPAAKNLIGVLPLVGPITYRGSAFTAFFGGTSLRKWQQSLSDLVDNPRVSSIIIDVDSPGGSVAGVAEVSEAVRTAAKIKPIVGVANTWSASAAYHIASQATQLYVTQSGEVGSIGVYSLHLDLSESLAQMGIKPTIIQQPQAKTEGNPYEPLSDEAREEMQATVDHYYDLFVKAVAKGRGVTPATVRKDFGAGRMVKPARALEVGMVDGIASFDSVLGKLIMESRRRSRARNDLQRRKLEIDALTL